MTLLLGIVYPLFITGVAQLFFREKANGSLIIKEGAIQGSSLIGQPFNNPAYFSSRPSATGYNPLPSGASNLSMTSKQLHQQMEERKENFLTQNKLGKEDRIPSEMLFASGSGLDPHISPEAATLQINRIVDQRKLSGKQKQELASLVGNMAERPQYHLFGESRINVLLLNLKIDELYPEKK